MNEASYQIIAELLAAHSGQQLTEDRRWRVTTALSSVFRKYGVDNLEQLTCLLDSDHDRILARDIVEALLNNETYFFRDKPTFEQLPSQILPILADRRQSSRQLRIWCAGCSSGQEVHSLSMEFAQSPSDWTNWSLEILGTDVSEKAISAACSGLYSQFEVQRGLSVVQMLQFFDETPDGWLLKKSIRDAAQFRRHNLLDPPPARTQFDLILCRNVLLYFDPVTRAKAFSRLFEALAPDGFLMLGAGESVLGRTQYFTQSGARPSIFEPVARPNSLARNQAASLPRNNRSKAQNCGIRKVNATFTIN